MANKYIGDLCFSTGEYEQDGKTKKRWTKAAAAFKSEEYGTVTFKFEALPASPEWSGYMRLFSNKKSDKPTTQNESETVKDEPINLSDIPF